MDGALISIRQACMLLLIASVCTAAPIRVACVGDSITAGYMASNASMTYPGRLQARLTTRFGAGSYNVTNFGAGGATVQRHADSPYWNRTQFAQFINGTFDIIVIMLGTNDAKSDRPECDKRVGPMRYDCAANWPAACSLPNATAESCSVVQDYLSLIKLSRTLLATRSSVLAAPLLAIMTPPPLWKDGAYGMMQSILNDVMPKLTTKIAKLANLPLPIDVYTALGGTDHWRSTFPACGCQRPAGGTSVNASAALVTGQVFDGGATLSESYTGTQGFLAVGEVSIGSQCNYLLTCSLHASLHLTPPLATPIPP
jgi:lysophospholipase L1-like esterase